jgi:hypothetical protein
MQRVKQKEAVVTAMASVSHFVAFSVGPVLTLAILGESLLSAAAFFILFI